MSRVQRALPRWLAPFLPKTQLPPEASSAACSSCSSAGRRAGERPGTVDSWAASAFNRSCRLPNRAHTARGGKQIWDARTLFLRIDADLDRSWRLFRHSSCLVSWLMAQHSVRYLSSCCFYIAGACDCEAPPLLIEARRSACAFLTYDSRRTS